MLIYHQLQQWCKIKLGNNHVITLLVHTYGGSGVHGDVIGWGVVEYRKDVVGSGFEKLQFSMETGSLYMFSGRLNMEPIPTQKEVTSPHIRPRAAPWNIMVTEFITSYIQATEIIWPSEN